MEASQPPQPLSQEEFNLLRELVARVPATFPHLDTWSRQECKLAQEWFVATIDVLRVAQREADRRRNR